MSTFLIRIQLSDAAESDYQSLGAAMAKENFIPGAVANQLQDLFAYFGNSNFALVNDAVQRAARSTGKPFSFSVMNNSAAEKQYHTVHEGHFNL